MERIEISTTDLNLSEVVYLVSKSRTTVELSDGQVPLVKMIPIEKPHSMAELDRELRNCTRLCDDANTFGQDVLSVRQLLGELDNPWESVNLTTNSGEFRRISGLQVLDYLQED